MAEAVYINAGNDNNGNPRRGWVIYCEGQILDFVDEGFKGKAALMDTERWADLMPSYAWIEVKPSVYNGMKKMHAK